MLTIDLRNRLENIGVKLSLPTLDKYLGQIQATGGGSRKDPFTKELLKALNELNHKMCQSTMYEYLNRLKEEKKAGGGTPNLQAPHATAHLSNQSQSTELWDFSNPAPPLIQAPQIAQQPSNFTSGNPGSSTSASNKGKSTNFSKAPGASSHYGGALPSQQAPPMYGTDVPFQAGIDSTNWLEENSQNDDGSLYSVVNPKTPSSWKNTLGSLSNWFAQQSSNFTSGNPGSSTSKGKSTNFSKAPGSSLHYGGAMPSQQAPPMYGTDVPSQAGIDSTNWLEENSQNEHQTHPTLIRATPAHRRITVARYRFSKPQCRARYSQHSQISRPINQPHLIHPLTLCHPNLERLLWIGAGEIRKTMKEIFIR
uniref:Uncharacterized protein n=1 Tax=Globodera rostochiensis TaxID=31243 RepID=A0A914I2C0_GLORO